MNSIKLRPANKKDCRFLYNLRNDPITRKFAFSSEEIPYETHKDWFERSLENKNRWIFIAEKNSRKIGEVRLDKENRIAEIDVAIAQEYRGKGYGTEILKKICEYGFDKLGIDRYIANIKKENIASIKSFANAGFKTETYRMIKERS